MEKYTSSQFARLLGISKSTLLAKEKLGLLPPSKREYRGSVHYRYYTSEDIAVFRRILNLTPLVKERRRQLFLNFERGVGKSIIAANYLYYVASQGIRCLGIDLDPQADLTIALGVNPDDYETNIGDILLGNLSLDGRKARINQFLDLIPANSGLAPLALDLNSRNAREFRLKMILEKNTREYDLVVMDVNSHPDILTLNAIIASNDLIIPILASSSNMKNLDILLEMIRKFQVEYPGMSLDAIHIFTNQLDNDSTTFQQNRDIYVDKYSDYLLASSVRFDPKIREGAKSGKNIFQYSPHSRVAEDIKRLSTELLKI